ncbi:patatin-like phospholipase family protein [Ferrimonas marina]|uniref:Predicted acylesterase/phospholipase RssA, contains patatin domain n=1 Tax=Ferrimonas marina TaxID=299255 RepID=A0A1M5Z686_9GAMM|nr:patatin-like phospholipase family protein [Ferrimonas marina]SHI19729.1 Predicted acylesterase/phospholipase RssA, contains patatin domain [Ferrimonas marina]
MPARTLCFCFVLLLTACASNPPRTLPEELTRTVPWGTLEAQDDLSAPEPIPEYAQIVINNIQSHRQQYPDQPIPMNLLLLSGGGVRGHYATGILSGWSETGTRPEFDIVTGVSVGALIATYAFLGSDYDQQMIHDGYAATELLSSNKAQVSLFKTGSEYVGEGFMSLLEQSLTPKVIAAVGEEYLKGRRLYVGTTNLDGARFTVWDLGKIAISDRADKHQLYRKVVLASASVPMLFPPVMFEVNTPEGRFEQMHVDGGVTQNVFFADYDAIWHEVEQVIELEHEDFIINNYVIHSGRLDDGPPAPPVTNSLFPIMARSVSTLLKANSASSIYKLWLTSMVQQANFHLASIPPDFELNSDLTQVDDEEMQRLFEQGYQRGKNGMAWLTQPPTRDQAELQRMLGSSTLKQNFERWFYKQRALQQSFTPESDIH